MAKHIGNVIESADCEHNTLASLFSCVSALCVALLTPDTGIVANVGKHGVSYARSAH